MCECGELWTIAEPLPWLLLPRGKEEGVPCLHIGKLLGLLLFSAVVPYSANNQSLAGNLFCPTDDSFRHTFFCAHCLLPFRDAVEGGGAEMS